MRNHGKKMSNFNNSQSHVISSTITVVINTVYKRYSDPIPE